MRIFPCLISVFLLHALHARAFTIQSSSTTATTTASTRTTSTSSQLYIVSPDKPSPQDIERAAGAEPPTTTTSTTSASSQQQQQQQQASIQGVLSPNPADCKGYADCIQHNQKLREQMFRLTQTRAYPLFLLEKAAKYLWDDIVSGVAAGLSAQANDNTSRMDSAAADAVDAATKDEISVTTTAADTNNNNKTAKEKLVILGAGWGAAALLQDIDTNRYDVTVISPRNFFVFTPMLAGASVGTVDVRSITQPIREFNRNADYLEAAATAIDPDSRTVTCVGVVCDEYCTTQEFGIQYDRLVIAVGAQINTFGIPGVAEYCAFLKHIEDATKIRRKLINLLERANMPGTTVKQLRELLTFCVIGAGPTGVEFAGELRDFLEEDGPKYYPHLLKYVRIKVIEATPVVLRPFDEELQQAAVDALTRKVTQEKSDLFPDNMLEVVVNTKVQQVTENAILLDDGTSIPYGLAVWAGGIGPLPITKEIIETLGGTQVAAQAAARGKIAVDPWLRAMQGDGRIFALGDCTWNQNNALPATAQVAAQEGEYLAHILSTGNFNAEYDGPVLLPPRRVPDKSKLTDAVTAISTGNNEYLAPFQFLDLGILAYTGGFSAIGQLQVTPSDKTRVKAAGSVGFGLWRSVYLLKQTSMRNRVLVFFDWMKTRMFGRDVSSFS